MAGRDGPLKLITMLCKLIVKIAQRALHDKGADQGANTWLDHLKARAIYTYFYPVYSLEASFKQSRNCRDNLSTIADTERRTCDHCIRRWESDYRFAFVCCSIPPGCAVGSPRVP